MHWKIQRDPYLAPVCEKHGEGAAWEAGFFLDDDPEDAPLDDVDWLCTPRPKRSVQGDRPAVLLATGGFCPVHAGHLAMMERARAAAEEAGFDVVGGYLSPGHDAYVRMKCGPSAIPAHERLHLCGAAAAASGWLSVDPWEAMHRRVAVNYTDVTARLRAYLRAHVDPRMEVLYVCGGDNARFGLAFTERGGCVVVGRPGADDETLRWAERLAGCPRVLWARGDHPAESRAIRAGAPAPGESRSRPRVVVRKEDARAARTLGLPRLAAFQDELEALLGRYAAVRSVAVEENAASPEPHVLSFDAMRPSTHNLAVSRLFAMGGYEVLGHVNRPGSPPLAEQIAAIPPGDYVLDEDDVMTGGTLAALRAALPRTVRVVATRFGIAHDETEDVVDARDFLLGADHGGLVAELPWGGIGRVPYLLPYFDPAVRASIPASHAFSIAVWRLNARTFAATPLRVRDLPESSRGIFRVDPGERLEDVCSWHADRLGQCAPLIA